MPIKWPWNRQQTPSEPPTPPAEPTIAPLTASAEARLSRLEAAYADLTLQWQETLDKLGRWSSRQAARERQRVSRDLDQLAGNGDEPHEDAPGTTNGGNGGGEGGQMDRATQKAQLRARALNIFRR